MRTPKPYWKTSHKCWYLRLDGRDIRLDIDEQKAQDEYFRLMAERANEPAVHDLTSERATIRQLLVAFLEWSRVNVIKGEEVDGLHNTFSDDNLLSSFWRT